MEMECVARLTGARRQKWVALLEKAGLEPDESWESTVLLW